MNYRPQIDKTRCIRKKATDIEIRIDHNRIHGAKKITKMVTCRRSLQCVTCHPIQAAVLDSVFLFYL